MLHKSKLKDLPYLTLVSGNFIVVIFLWLLAIWRYRISADFISLHYTIYFGLDRFGPKIDLFLFPTLGTVILVLNIIIARMVIEDNRLWQLILFGLTLAMQIILFISFVLSILKAMS